MLPTVQAHLADVLWFHGLELESDGNKTEPKKQYTALIQLLLKKKLMGEELLLSRLENDVLQDVGLVDDAKEAGYYAGWMLAAPQLARVRLWGDHSCRANNTVPG